MKEVMENVSVGSETSSNQTLSALSEHHEQICGLLKETMAKHGTSTVSSSLVRQLFLQLRLHSILEQQILFPYISSVIDRERIKTSGKDFYTMLSLMLELEQVHPGSEAFELSLSEIAERFIQHAQEQEGKLFPELAQCLSLDLSGLNCRLRTRKFELAGSEAAAGYVCAPKAGHLRCA